MSKTVKAPLPKWEFIAWLNEEASSGSPDWPAGEPNDPGNCPLAKAALAYRNTPFLEAWIGKREWHFDGKRFVQHRLPKWAQDYIVWFDTTFDHSLSASIRYFERKDHDVKKG